MGYIYLIKQIDSDYYKIGVTKGDVNKRIKQLQTGCSDDLILIETFKTKHYFKIEKMLHRYFQEKKVIGEWFVLNKEDRDIFVEKCEIYDKNMEVLKDNYFLNKKRLTN